ncbi:hypothetical protein [Nocardia sp. CA-290969]|uniref:hypothetical protein n=1 Tax=Nocardia sp. CA-290969 TaxID=3239986 RepID=UPI003D911137
MNTPARYQPLNPTPARIDLSQATAIEQSRAIAEVQAAVLVAQQRPRNKALAVDEMRDATAQHSVAERAYFRYVRSDTTVTGVSIHLARELARCWGNIDYGIKELSRDDAKGESEMLAHAWDMQTNARASTTFIVPHVRDTSEGARKLTATRDIYENNANAGARRLREQILAVLPNWFVEEAKANCDATLKKGNGEDLATRITNATYGFAVLGVTEAQLVAKVGKPMEDWDGGDVGRLGVVYQSIKRGETTVGDEFPTPQQEPAEGLTTEDLRDAGDNSEPAAEKERKRAPRKSTKAQREQIDRRLDELDGNTPEQVSAYLSTLLEREIASTADLTYAEAVEVIGELDNQSSGRAPTDTVAEATTADDAEQLAAAEQPDADDTEGAETE